jgi:hypothetical protein
LNVAGALFFIAGTLILLGIVTAEASHPGYSVSRLQRDLGIIHWLLSGLTFIAGGFAAIAAFNQQKAPLRYFSVILGIIALVFAIGPYITPAVAFLGVGGAERWVAYPIVLWLGL